jgi:hypothetical protein
MKSHAGGNRPGRLLSPLCHGRIVAPFGCEGKPRACPEIAHIQQFRVFPGYRQAVLALPTLPQGWPRAIVVLVERGGPMIATRPDKGIFAPRELTQTQNRIRSAFQERLS